jgi:hypothetical protein
MKRRRRKPARRRRFLLSKEIGEVWSAIGSGSSGERDERGELRSGARERSVVIRFN